MPETTRTTRLARGGLTGGRGRRFAALALVVAGLGFLAIMAGGIGQNLVYYWGPTELAAAGDKAFDASVRLGGLVADGSIRRAAGASGVEFDVVDRKGGLTHVRCSGVPPQLFRERIGVVVEGTMTRAGYFEGRRLMVSHSNEYRAPTERENLAIEALMRSVREGGERAGDPAGGGAGAAGAAAER